TPTPGRTARQLRHHRAGLGRRRLPRTVAHLGERRSHPYYADHQTHPRRRRFPRPAPHLGGREKFRVDQQAPPLRARLRNQTRPPPSHGPPRHHHDHDQATRPNLTVFKHPLSHVGRHPIDHAGRFVRGEGWEIGDVAVFVAFNDRIHDHVSTLSPWVTASP